MSSEARELHPVVLNKATHPGVPAPVNVVDLAAAREVHPVRFTGDDRRTTIVEKVAAPEDLPEPVDDAVTAATSGPSEDSSTGDGHGGTEPVDEANESAKPLGCEACTRTDDVQYVTTEDDEVALLCSGCRDVLANLGDTEEGGDEEPAPAAPPATPAEPEPAAAPKGKRVGTPAPD